MAYDPRAIANAVLERANQIGRPLTNLDLQKIVYFLHGHFLRRHGRPLVDGEFEAWTYGPVHRTLYEAFKAYGDGPVDARATSFDPIRRVRRELPALSDPEAIEVLDDVLHHYLDIPTFALVEITHQRGSPWHATVEAAERRPNVGMKITDALILEHFEGTAPEPASARKAHAA